MNLFNSTLLKELRKQRGLTQLEASQKLGIARTTYADYEKGKIQPPIDKLQRISMWLDIPTERLMQANNDTGIDLDIFKKWEDAEVKNVQIIKRIKAKTDIYESFDEFVDKVKELELSKDEKDLIINLLDYIYMRNYQFTPEELKYREKMQEVQND